MKTRKYLHGGIEISELGFGAWQLGVDSGWKAVTESEAERMIRTALDRGINFYDTAPNYGNGTSEERLGEGVQDIGPGVDCTSTRSLGGWTAAS